MTDGERLGRRELLSLGAVVLLSDVLPACAPRSSARSAVDARGPWSTGGTAAMTDKGNYPDPFAGGTTVCSVTCQLTEGPCYSSQSEERADISYGQGGLPMRMALRVVDPSCKPVPNALVDVWHVGPAGKYSGNDASRMQVGFCTANDPEFTSHLYFRGKQRTDGRGVVAFDTCFPGWYRGRALHVHLTISVGERAYVTTQLGFDDALGDHVIATQPLYGDRGPRDTKNAHDTVFPAEGTEAYLFDVQRLNDGAMLASKTLVLRESLDDAICGPSGRVGPPPDGGPPGFPPPPGWRPGPPPGSPPR